MSDNSSDVYSGGNGFEGRVIFFSSPRKMAFDTTQLLQLISDVKYLNLNLY
jgi:hypothetical protein